MFDTGTMLSRFAAVLVFALTGLPASAQGSAQTSTGARRRRGQRLMAGRPPLSLADSRFAAGALAVTFTVRLRSNWFVFGVPRGARLWESLGSGAADAAAAGSYVLQLYPLRRGPSGNLRFLAKSIASGCGGSLGLGYDAEEWDGRRPAL